MVRPRESTRYGGCKSAVELGLNIGHQAAFECQAGTHSHVSLPQRAESCLIDVRQPDCSSLQNYAQGKPSIGRTVSESSSRPSIGGRPLPGSAPTLTVRRAQLTECAPSAGANDEAWPLWETGEQRRSIPREGREQQTHRCRLDGEWHRTGPRVAPLDPLHQHARTSSILQRR